MSERKIWVIKTTYERNANDGISYYTDLQSLADAVHEAEQSEAHVQVYECVPVSHHVAVNRVSIYLGKDAE